MQRVRANGWKRIVFEIIPVIVLALTILFDQLSKSYFHALYLAQGTTTVIDNFFYLTYTVNTGAAWSFLAGVPWAQTFFKVLTSVALIAFIAYYVFAVKKGQSFLKYALVLIIGGTIGNFIDRLSADGVVDFLSFVFGDYHFPVFNLADSFLTVGVVMLIIHYLFIDVNAVFRKSKKEEVVEEKLVDGGGENVESQLDESIQQQNNQEESNKEVGNKEFFDN